jgi:hypothetical protein
MDDAGWDVPLPPAAGTGNVHRGKRGGDYMELRSHNRLFKPLLWAAAGTATGGLITLALLRWVSVAAAYG